MTNTPLTEKNIESNGSDSQAIDIKYLGSREDSADSRTVASRKRLRDQMTSEVEAFLAGGGKISQVAAHETADPPQRPSSNYGQRPI